MSSESLNIQLETTADGSPTFRFCNETMHNREGAFSESVYVYLEAMSEALELIRPCHTLSVGLGLGYNEMLWAALSLRHDLHPGEWQLTSYESENDLRDFFLQWLLDKELNVKLKNAYDEIASRVAHYFELSPQDIKTELIQRREWQDWVLSEKLTAKTTFSLRANCILYDAYSSNTSPELWEPDFLNEFTSSATAPTCVFSTYAAKGHLTRALQKEQFKVQLRTGFGGKRQSTWAVRTSFSK